MAHPLFTPQFMSHLQLVIQQHHLLYPRIPPRDIFFESLVERAFRMTGLHPTAVVPTTPNMPQEDLQIGRERISLKTETGRSTKRDLISITKLCTTEREPWVSEVLIERVLEHLSRYDHILMLRAVRTKAGIAAGGDSIHYQLLDIPISLLALMRGVGLAPVGRRSTRKSLAGDVSDGQQKVFRVHFDGTDGKCQIQRLLVSRCETLLEWDYYVNE